MGISKREKVMLAGLAVIACGYFTYTKFFIPEMEKLELQREALSGNMKIMSRLDKGLVEKEKLKEKVKALKIAVDEIDQSLPEHVHQENVILYIRDVFSRNNIEVSSVGYSDPGEIEEDPGDVPIDRAIEDYMKYLESDKKLAAEILEGEDDSKEDEAGENSKYNSLGVSVSFSGEYSDLKSALREIEEHREKILIKNLAMNNTSEDIAGSISLEFPFYPDSRESVNEDWRLEGDYGNSNPFATGRLSLLQTPQGRQDASVPSGGSSPVLSVDSDFYIVLKPVSSDMPTVTMGKSPYRYTAVYADDNSFKEANIHIKQEGGKYLFRYKVSSNSYPSGEGEYEAMQPFGDDIVMKVYSMTRLNEQDSSGLVLNVYNDTDKDVKIYVGGDDASNPRFRAEARSGNVYTHQF